MSNSNAAISEETCNKLKFPDEVIKHCIMLAEYRLVCREPIDGLYIIPSAGNICEWFGLLFIRHGVYFGSVLRFTLVIPSDFPSSSVPKIKFDQHVFHPHIDPITNEVDVTRFFPEGWKSDNHHVYHLLFIVQRIFFYFDAEPTSCVNTDAANALRNDKETFRERVKEVIKRSRSVIYDPPTCSDPNFISFSPWDAVVHEPIRKRIIGSNLMDSRISEMCASTNSSYFNSAPSAQRKCGYSWISPTDLTFMNDKYYVENIVSKSNM